MRRRDVLSLSLGGLISLMLPPSARADQRTGGWLTGFGTQSGRYGLALIKPDLSVSPLLTSDFRLHDILVHPRRFELCAPARRPGDRFWIVNEAGEAQLYNPGPGRHCLGHGAYSPDGSTLYLPENDFEAGEGVIGVYEVVSGYRKRGEFKSNGVGPHEILMTPEGRHLIVANGGILTHPETGRAKLNLDSMAPNLTLIELATGKVVEQASLPSEWHQLSIRHIDQSPDSTIAFALQDQVRTGEPRPLVGLWRPGSAPVVLQEPEGSWLSFKSYIGSVAFDASGAYVAATSPKAGRAGIWAVESGDFLGFEVLADVCGVAPTPEAGAFLLTTGTGAIAELRLRGDEQHLIRSNQAALRFDNHCSMI